MKKRYKMEQLDCANCAAKMEERIKKIPGVQDASVNFLMQKLTIEADDDRFDEILRQAQQVCASVERDCRIVL